MDGNATDFHQREKQDHNYHGIEVKESDKDDCTGSIYGCAVRQ